MVSYPTINLVDSIIDEVALEGLDGITLEALWLRLANRYHDPLPLPKSFMEQVWSICIQVKPFAFYLLDQPRKPLVLMDRYEYVDPDIGTILEPDNVPEDIYPHYPVDDPITGNKGSCSSYNTRKDISAVVTELSLDEVVEKYGQSLVIVATQVERERALIGDNVCPALDLTVIQYCFLERVGRSRYHGEVTQGKLSLNCLNEDPKSLFYHRKFLLRHKLITKQMHHQKSVSSGHSCSGSLLHLPRFFVERKPKVIFLAEQVINILKSKENYVAEYKEIKKALQIENCIKKLFKTAFFQKVVKADLRVPYRTLYPNADVKEWQHKNHPPNEKVIRVVQLVDPNIDISELWNKDEMHDDEDSFEIEISNHKYNVPFLRQANTVVEGMKRDGICQGGLLKEMGLTKLQSRTILRNLVKANLVATYMNDMGRQRLTKYVSKKFEKSSTLSKQFEQELHKIKELTKTVAAQETPSQKMENSERAIEMDNSKIPSIDFGENAPSNNDQADSTLNNAPPENDSVILLTQRKSLFKTVNRLFRKYRLVKIITPYECTSSSSISKSKRKAETSRQRSKSHSSEEKLTTGVSDNVEIISIYNNVKTNLITQKPIRTGKAIDEAFGFMEDVKINERKDVSNITYRLLKRANMIIESVNEHQVIDDATKLLKMITEEEDKEGYDVRIDKKSLLRLLNKLAKDNLIKIIKLTLSVNNREKHLTFICNPNIDINHTVIKSAVEQAKVKFSLITSNRLKSNAKHSTEKSVNCRKNSQKSGIVEKDSKESGSQKRMPNYKVDTKIGRAYGHGPKFVRLKVMHILLYYMVYDHPGEQMLSKEEQIQALEKAGHTIPKSLRNEMSTVYKTEVSWKMFIPPLPEHGGWPKGWALICDVLWRTPLSIFLKIHKVPFAMPDLETYIRHPIRKHFLVKDLPLNIRNALFHGRKYIYDVHLTVMRLCFLGLVQFGPQRLKEKDQVFVYINRRTELRDTTSSGPSYHKVENKEYPAMVYTFSEMHMVEKYWYDMWNICINTPLGGRLAVQGKDILLEELEKKSQMVEAVKARNPEEAITMDSGNVPGDRRGAAGLDSAFFAHLKRNWNWSNSSFKKQPKCETASEKSFQRQAYLSQIKAKPFKFTEFSGLKKVTGPSSVNAKNLRSMSTEQRAKPVEVSNVNNKVKRHQVLTSQRSARQKTFVRTVLPRKVRNRTRIKYDEIDYRALQRMHKLRVDWEPHEDSMLLICKVAMMYLCPSSRKQLVSFTAVRDFLRSCSASSYNKTSRACQRRLVYMLKRQDAANSVTLGVEEIKQNYFINKRFGGAVDKIKLECEDPNEQEARVAEVFKELVSYIAKKYFDLSDIGPKQPMPVPKTAQEFNIFYKVVHPAKSFGHRGFLKDVHTTDDIYAATINSVIHSSMCCGKDRRSWAYQLFKVYQQYPEILLRNAMAKIRSDQMVTVKKNHMCILKKYGNCMPMSSSQYQLSTYYAHKFHTKWPYEVFRETYDVFSKLVSEHDARRMNSTNSTNYGTEISPVTGGTVTAIHDYFVSDCLDLDIEIPDQMIMLDPRLHEKDETYLRIAKRYQDILASLDQPIVGNELTTEQLDGERLRSSENVTYGVKRRQEENIELSSSKRICGNMNSTFSFSKKDISPLNPKITAENVNTKNNKNELGFSCKEIKSDKNKDAILNNPENLTCGVDKNTYKSSTSDLESTQDNDTTDDLQYCIPDTKPILSSTMQKNQEVKVSDKSTNAEGSIHMKTNLQKEENQSKSRINKRPASEDSTDDSSLLRKKIKSNNTMGSSDGNSQTQLNEEFEAESSSKLTKDIEHGLDDKTCNITGSNTELQETYPDETTTGHESGLNQTDVNKEMNSSDIENIGSQLKEITIVQEKQSTSEFAKFYEGGYTRVSDIVGNLPTEQTCQNLHRKLEDANDEKRYTRIALLKMREELNDLTVADSHHAHDLFVVNMCKIGYLLKSTNDDNPTNLETFEKYKLPKDIIPLSLNSVNQIINNISASALFPKDIMSYSDCKKTMLKDSSINWSKFDTVYKFVRDKKELGASAGELMEKFHDSLGRDLCEIISILTKHHIFLRSGVTTVRYIHHRHASPWLIRSYRIHRLNKECRESTSDKNENITEAEEQRERNKAKEFEDVVRLIAEEVSSGDRPPWETDGEKVKTNVQSASKAATLSNNENRRNEKQSSESEDDDAGVVTKMQRNRTSLLPQKEIYMAAKQLDFTTAEEIRVIMKPWIRIDGILNRKVLDRMLGAVLSYCLTHPGVTLSKVQNRFVPALQPFHTLELVEILIKIGCLERKLLNKSRVTLFSKPSKVKPKAGDDWANEEEIFLEPMSCAVLKFSIFQCKEMYNVEFIP